MNIREYDGPAPPPVHTASVTEPRGRSNFFLLREQFEANFLSAQSSIGQSSLSVSVSE